MAKQKRTVIQTHEIHRLLQNRYCAPAWAFLHEVRNSTGYRRTVRTADGIAMSLWPSRGLDVHGFEVKASRSDLRKELEDPTKAREIQQYCDHWWLVIGHKDLIQPGELPSTWGLMVAQKNRLKAIVDAPRLEAKPLDRGFVASLLRNYTECYVPKSMLNAMVQEKYQEWQDAKGKADDRELVLLRGQVDRLKKTISEFEQASGVQIGHSWHVGKIGDAVRKVLYSHSDDFLNAEAKLEGLIQHAEKVIEETRQEIETMRSIGVSK